MSGAADITIVGAGIVGICCAAQLAEAGHAVTVVDRTGICEETSSGNAAALAFSDLLPLVEAARRDARLLEDDDPEWFALTMAEAEASPENPERFHDQGFGHVEDVVGELAEALDDPEGEEASEPVRNPSRTVGRNDPCPCGSGKKFKKCCLEAGND